MSRDYRHAAHGRERYLDQSDDHPTPLGRRADRPAPGKRTMVSRVYRAAAGPAPDRLDAVSALERAAAAAGRSLPPELRAMLERALGVSLGDVRVHDDAASADAAAAIAARAYTVGRDIHFAHGTYAPDDSEGRRLIAHEVAHAVQHGGQAAPSAGGELALSQPGDAAELEADRFADDFVGGVVTRPVAAPLDAATPAVIHREAEGKDQNKDKDADNAAALAKIQAKAMYALLPALRDIKPAAARSDEKAAYQVGGRRLVIAQRAVAHKGKWIDFVSGQQETLAGLPGNQVSDIMAFLGAPEGAAYYDSRKFDGRFDGMIDPDGKKIVLYWRVKVEAHENARFGRAEQVGPPSESDPDKQNDLQKNQQKQHEAHERETKAAIAKFKKDLPGAIQKNWKTRIKPSGNIGKLGPGNTFDCSVVVTVVESGEHKLVYVTHDVEEGRSSMPKDPSKPGILRESANVPNKKTEVSVGDESGTMLKDRIPVQQTGSAHEFGHAIGLDHPVCEEEHERCYGVTADQKSSQMGLGSEFKKTQGTHNDFAAFLRIAQVWTAEQKLDVGWTP